MHKCNVIPIMNICTQQIILDWMYCFKRQFIFFVLYKIILVRHISFICQTVYQLFFIGKQYTYSPTTSCVCVCVCVCLCLMTLNKKNISKNLCSRQSIYIIHKFCLYIIIFENFALSFKIRKILVSAVISVNKKKVKYFQITIFSHCTN